MIQSGTGDSRTHVLSFLILKQYGIQNEKILWSLSVDDDLHYFGCGVQLAREYPSDANRTQPFTEKF